MRCFWLIPVLFYWAGAAVETDSRLLRTFQNVLDEGAISNECSDALRLYFENLMRSDNDQWAVRMLDATSKIPVGLQSLNFGELGQFSQCLSTESEDGHIQGKYCLAKLSLSTFGGASLAQSNLTILQRRAYQLRRTSNLMAGLQTRDETDDDFSAGQPGISWALCIPSNCTDRDVALIFSNLSETTHATCQTKSDLSPPLTTGAITAIVILSIFAFLLVMSTALDLYYKHKRIEPPLALVAFSMYSNGRKVFRINHNSTELTCLNGMRFFSILWVIAGHIFQFTIMSPVYNYIDAMEWLDTLRSMVIASGVLAVDTFFFLSGLLVVYGFLKAKYHGVKFDIFQFYIHRYLRLTPALAALVLITATLTKYMGSGPNWGNMYPIQNDCEKYWWATLLYLQNYVTPNMRMCLSHTWYLSIDMQLYVLSPLILLPLWKYPKIGISLIIAAIVAFIVVPFVVAYDTGIPALMTNMESSLTMDYMSKYYMKTHTRAAPWFIGAMLGYLLAKIKFQGDIKTLKLNKVVVLFIWGACFAILMTCIFGGHSRLRGADYNKIESSSYIALVRPTWTVCLSWIVLACVSGYGGPINWFLSLPIYQVLNKFAYSVYLLHFQIGGMFVYAKKSGIYFDELSTAYSFWGLTMFSFGLAFIWVLAFESPVLVLEKLIFSSPKRKNKLEENGNKNGLPA